MHLQRNLLDHMKKSILLTLPVLAMLAACGNQNAPAEYQLNVSVATPAGAPAVALYQDIKNELVEVNADPANVVAYLTASASKDVVIVPTNAGLTAITKKSAPFKIAATITFGNFFLASTGNDEDGKLDDGDYVVAFQQNNVPDKIFKYCYSSLNNVHYVTAASDAAAALVSGVNISDNNAKVDYVLMAEPALAAALSKNTKAKEYANLQSVFKEKSGGKEITQASIFVNNSADKTKVNAFLSRVETGMASFLKDPTVLDAAIEGLSEEQVKAKFSSPAAMLKNMTTKGNRMGLGYKNAYENRAAIENFVSLFGITGLNEEVYYK